MSRASRRIAGSGEPLVLIHGLGHTRHAWFPVLEALERCYEVLSLDLPGFGEAPPLPADIAPSVPALADAVEQEMEAAGFRTAHLCGNSMGGWIALELARRGRARTVVAISPAGGGTRRERAYARSLFKLVRRASIAGSPVAEAVAAPGPTRPLFFGLFFARPNRLPRDEAAYAIQAFAKAPAFPAACDLLFARRADGLDQVTCPVTIAWGTRDLLLFPRQARHFLAQLPSARKVTLERLGHVPMYDDPPRLARVILDQTGGQRPPGEPTPPWARAQALRPSGG